MKKLISALLVAALLMGGLAGCSSKKPVGTDTSGTNISAGIDENAKPPKTGPVGQWDIPIPEINPLGSQELYTTTDYEIHGITVKYIDNFAEYNKDVMGEVWTLEVEDPSGVPLHFLNNYASSIKASIFTSYYGDRLTFTLKKDEESLWWGDALQTDTGYRLKVVREAYVPVSKEKTFTLASLQEEVDTLSFTTSSTGKRFQFATVKAPSGSMTINATDYYSTGVMERRVYYSRVLDTAKATTFVLDDIPQGEGTLTWTFSWESHNAPVEFSFLLEELEGLPHVKQGEALGALKVCGVPFGSAVIQPQQGFDILHADGYSLNGDITPEGDTLFWLPAGLWNVVLADSSAGLESSIARFVPVSAGELTVFTLPNSLKSAYYTLNNLFANPEDLTGGIELVETKDLGTTASISMLINDPLKRDVFPTKDNTIITEGGKQVEITNITRQVTPPSIVLVLDSSGSMGNQMPATLAAAKQFLAGLPDNTFVKVIDFDSAVRVLSGETKDAVIKSLSPVTAGGSTKLFDATLRGLELLDGKPRPALVVFADGADSSLDGQGVGSDSSIEEVLEALQEAPIPVFTIGFGTKPDERAMREFSLASGGQYYSAKDNKALPDVFAAISGKFGNSFVMTYNRPKEAGVSETPVVTFVMDASGSMDTDPEEEGCGYRMERTKALFHDFILKLPDKTLMQMIGFQTYALGGSRIIQEQITTAEKVKVLQGLGALESYGGTPILEAVRIAFEHIRVIPSSKRVMVYLTDAALDVEDDFRPQFEQLLTEIKDAGVLVLWAGMGVENEFAAFEKAAELSGGKYVVSEDAAGLESALTDLLTSMQNVKPTGGMPLSVVINDKSSFRELMSYAANTIVNFTPPKKSTEVVAVDVAKVSTGTPLKRYDSTTAALVTGTGVPGLDTIITKRIAFAAKSNNLAMDLSVNEAFYFSKLKGLEAPADKQFLGLQLNMKNTTKDKIQYQIPSMNSHFYVNINNEGSYPASDATWLTATPVSPPGNSEINVFTNKDLAGMMVFLVPDGPLTQASLHFYDTSHGHINIPLVGKMDKALLQLDRLPTASPTQITDAFSMTLTASSVTDKVDIYEAEENTSFRLVEASVTSKVQALLDIDPANRLWLKIDTANGPLLTKMSEVTVAMPFGFLSPVMLAPGATSTVRFAYPIAKALAGVKMDIWGDVQSGSLQIPLVKGNVYGKASNESVITGDGFKLKINQLTNLDDVEGFDSAYIVADVTFIDVKDGFGTQIPEDFFKLVRSDVVQSQWVKAEGAGLGNFGSGGLTDDILLPEYFSSKLLYGVGDDWPVFDGAERRGLVVFLLPESGHKWVLKSPYMEKLNEPIATKAYTSPELLVYKKDYDLIDQEFEATLASLVAKEIVSYNSIKGAMGITGTSPTVSLEQGLGKNTIPVPLTVTSGMQKIKSVTSLSNFTTTMQALKWLPSSDYPWNYRNSPEAVLTQGFGTVWDLANTAMGLASKCGVTPKRRLLALTAKGIQELKNLSKLDEKIPRTIPGIWYINEQGQSKLFAIPFMKDISELSGLVYIPANQAINEFEALTATIRVSAKVVATQGSAQSGMSDAGAALGGGETQGQLYEYIELLTKTTTLPALSLDAVEVGYMEAGAGKGKLYTAIMSTSDGMQAGTGAVDTGEYKLLGLRIEMDLSSGTLTHETSLATDETPDKFYHTLAINLPDLPDEAVKNLEAATGKEYKAANNPDALSALKWYGRNILNRFIATQTSFDLETGAALKLVLGRTDKERCMVLTTRLGADNKMRTTMDLVQAVNQIHSGDKTARAAYNIAAGLFASSLEAAALTGSDKAGYLELWEMAPQETTMLLILNEEERGAMLAEMEEAGYFPSRLLETVRETDLIILTPDRPSEYGGQKRWAWLEINPETYETISVFDTGERAGMASYAMSLMPSRDDWGQYIVGALIGADVAVWSVCSSSLKLGDYKEILADAKATAQAIGKCVNEVMEARSQAMSPSATLWKQDAGGVTFSLKASPKGFKAGIGQNIIGFSDGFNDAVNFYFKNAGK